MVSPRLRQRLSRLSARIARFSPLVAALIAPASTLYDIPALTQQWYSLNGAIQPDPQASLVLSGVGLALSVIANALLVLRFTVHLPGAWRIAITASTTGWILKTILTIANLITFGALTRNSSGYAYEQGFWCAVLSVILAGVVSFLLLFHIIFRTNKTPDEEIRFQGRTFIVSELTLFAVVALEALIFSRIEDWSYLDGIYFTVVSMLSIGFGDFSPTHTATKVLLFPFEIVGIALLSNQISLIVGVVKTRVEERRRQWYQAEENVIEEKYERKWLDRKRKSKNKLEHGRKKNRHRPQSVSMDVEQGADESSEVLRKEISRLHRLASQEAAISQLFDLLWSAGVLVLFWVVGAVIFHYMEGWSIGDAFYFNYVFFLTIGYGDFAPATPVGRVVFIVWALMAVPIMTNFVVTTIQAIIERLSKLLALTAREKRKERQRTIDEYFESHDKYLSAAYSAFREDWEEETPTKNGPGRAQAGSEFDKRNGERHPHGSEGREEVDETKRAIVDEAERAIDQQHDEKPSKNGKYDLAIQPPKSIIKSTSTRQGEGSSEEHEVGQQDATTEAIHHALSLATYLEAQGRALLIDALPEVAPERLLLQADANVQVSRLAELDGEVPPWMDTLKKSIEHEGRLDRIKIYRMTYARLLVAGRRVLSLEGDRAASWERKKRDGEMIHQNES